MADYKYVVQTIDQVNEVIANVSGAFDTVQDPGEVFTGFDGGGIPQFEGYPVLRRPKFGICMFDCGPDISLVIPESNKALYDRIVAYGVANF